MGFKLPAPGQEPEPLALAVGPTSASTPSPLHGTDRALCRSASAGNVPREALEFSAALSMSASDPKSDVSVDSQITNMGERVGGFTKMGSVNNGDLLSFREEKKPLYFCTHPWICFKYSKKVMNVLQSKII